MPKIETAEDLKNTFRIQNDGLYEDFIAFEGGKPGFSIKRKYPSDIPFKPPVRKDDSPDTLAMFRVLYNPEDLPEAELDLTKVPIWIDIGKHSKYQYNHFGFNFDDDDCPTERSLSVSQASPRPIGLSFSEEFFFNHSTNDFVDKDGQHLSGLQVLQSVFDQHCNTTVGLRRRMWRSIAKIGFLCEHLISFFEFILRVSFRKRFERSRSPLAPYRKEDIVLLKAESLQIFGYKTTKNVIVTYAALVLVVYTVSYFTFLRESTFLASIWKHPFLVLCLTFVSLPLLDHQGPNLIRMAVNALNSLLFWSIMHSPVYGEERTKKNAKKKSSNQRQHKDRS